jgi:hypothetical protein
MILDRRILLVFVLACCGSCSRARDVSSVSFRGGCPEYGMEVQLASFADGGFSVATTGARFEYTPGRLKIYQGLGSDIGSKRLLATVEIEGASGFEEVESNKDHVLVWSENLNIGIYSDSTCILAPKNTLSVSFTGDFKPDYEGRQEGELLLIDGSGGMEIYPQRYEAGYKAERIELGKRNWLARYTFNASERVMLAAFPGKPFDWEKSFKTRIIVTHASMGLGIGNPYGQMPPDDKIVQWSKNYDILVLFYKGLYERPGGDYRRLTAEGPYVVENEPEFRRLVKTAHQNNLKVITYCSLFSYYWKFRKFEPFYEQIKALRDKFAIDGVYVDGLTFDYHLSRDSNKIANWETIRRLRQLFGPDGVVVCHGTHNLDRHVANPVATAPNIDSYCTATLYGEGVPFDSVDDSYVKYQVRKYGISNTVGMWRYDMKPSSITYEEITDAILRMNGREMAYGWVPLDEPPKTNQYTWGSGFNERYSYYAQKLTELQREYKKRRYIKDK